jgi:hypothetical protein
LTNKTRLAAIAGGVVAVAVLVFFVLGNRSAPGLGVFGPSECPLTGLEPPTESALDRPALAIKIENSPAAYPLSGLEKAEVVYEEVVEGGLTRFMAIYHCTDSRKGGPVRSARFVDPVIVSPYTHILAFSGSNAIVRKALDKAGIVSIDETNARGGMRRVPREGVSSEHTLYGKTKALRRLGEKKFDDGPANVFSFGKLQTGSKRASSVTISFGGAGVVVYEFSDGKWLRTQDGEPFLSESGDRIATDNVLIEEHEVKLSKTIKDVAGNPSVEIADETGSGRAVLFRDGRVIVGKWVRESKDDPASFETRAGEEMIFKPGTTWIELVPSTKGEVKGSFSYEK